jgi:hypothetical protein
VAHWVSYLNENEEPRAINLDHATRIQPALPGYVEVMINGSATILPMNYHNVMLLVDARFCSG